MKECVDGGVFVRKIALVGPMGAGKSSVGRRLSGVLGCSFIDLDEAIEQYTKQSIAEIFSESGEAEFRSIEHQQLEAFSTSSSVQSVVLATGGGIVETPQNRALLEKHWYTVWLDSDVQTLAKRVEQDSNIRPLLQQQRGPLLEQRLQELVSRRAPWYQQVARVRVQVAGLTVEEVVNRLLQLGL